MPSGSYLQADVQCPFYLYDDGRKKIVCEGFADRCTIDVRWRFHAQQEQHMQVFCCRRYTYCEVYRMIMQAKYGEEEHNDERSDG
ncbi:MAG: hypothetical protein IKZ82_06315 [Clostridia bacterium]|nr:hypothetical protein [Clostridia bacterium]